MYSTFIKKKMVKKIVKLKLDWSRTHKSRWDKNIYVKGFIKNTNHRLGQDSIELRPLF